MKFQSSCQCYSSVGFLNLIINGGTAALGIFFKCILELTGSGYSQAGLL
jgi:hypothetical protein